MVAQDVAPTRLGAATAAAGQFVNGLPRSYRVGLVPFSSTATVAVAPTFNHAAVQTALRSLHADGGTAIGDAISLALAVGRPSGERPGAPPPDRTKGSGRVILLLSDGANSSGIDPMTAAAQAKAEGVKVYTVAFGTANGVVSAGPYGQIVSVPPDPTTLKAVAQATGGEFFAAADADTLRRVYKNIGSQVGTTKQHEDVSYAFAGIGAVLLTAAGLLSTLWRSQIT
jgi:Ca-activated chloride channel family protein